MTIAPDNDTGKYQAHNVRDLDDRRAPDPKEPLDYTPEAWGRLTQAAGWHYRWNLRAQRIERTTTPHMPGTWQTVTDRSDNGLREAIAARWITKNSRGEQRWRPSVQRWIELRDAYLYHHEVDPVAEWLWQALPQWDGLPRVEFLLTTLYGADINDPMI